MDNVIIQTFRQGDYTITFGVPREESKPEDDGVGNIRVIVDLNVDKTLHCVFNELVPKSTSIYDILRMLDHEISIDSDSLMFTRNSSHPLSIFVVCPVRNVDADTKELLEGYVESLESSGHKVHYPLRDTPQDKTGYEICKCNRDAIGKADQVHVYYDGLSQGTHFDLGVAFALGKPLSIIYSIPDSSEGKSFVKMIKEWETIEND